MTRMTLVHISDLHFSSPHPHLPPDNALRKMTDALRVRGVGHNAVLLISGDITTCGDPNGFHGALHHLGECLKAISFAKVVVCPGNHDLTSTTGREFGEFNRFAFALTNDPEQTWSVANPVRRVRVGDHQFVLINSSAHGDHSFGRVPMAPLREALDTSGEGAIVVVHHSPISSQYGGGSLENSYELLAAVTDARAAVLLHGDNHSDQVLLAGRHETYISGIGSLAFSPDPNMNNQFACYEFDDGRMIGAELFRYFANRDRFIGSAMEGI